MKCRCIERCSNLVTHNTPKNKLLNLQLRPFVSRANYMSIGPQNDPTFHEHASQGFHIVLGEA